MVLKNGEKFACEACIRGHRVSTCQHTERELHHIARKGRPVSQCQQCRSSRKSRNIHTSCDCGRPSHKCKHLLEIVDGHKESCCCNHGDPCTCHLTKKEPLLDTVHESDESDHDEPAHALSRISSKLSHDGRRRANTDASLTFDENGHHKPTYKHVKAHETSGPYQWTRAHSSHDTTRLTNRSVDSLLHSSDILPSSGVGVGLQVTRSENASPGPAAFPVTGNSLTPLDLSNIAYESYDSDNVDFFNSSTPDLEPPLFSASLSAPPVDWSNYEGLEFASKAADADSFAPSNYSQAQSFGTWDAIGSEQPPTLTTATSNSGTVSEAGDFISNDVFALGSSLRSSTGSLPLDLGQGDAELLNQSLGDIDFEQFKFSEKFPSNSFSVTSTSNSVSPTVNDTSYLAMTSNAFSALDGQDTFWPSDPSMPTWEDVL